VGSGRCTKIRQLGLLQLQLGERRERYLKRRSAVGELGRGRDLARGRGFNHRRGLHPLLGLRGAVSDRVLTRLVVPILIGDGPFVGLSARVVARPEGLACRARDQHKRHR
jgi:hypothetical protein